MPPRDAVMASAPPGRASVGTCPDCGKRQYVTRKAARQVARRGHLRSSQGLQAYRCGDYWHLGHISNIQRQRGIK